MGLRSIPTIPRPVQNVWVEIARKPMKGTRYQVRYSMGRESVVGRATWSISIIDPNRGTIICRVFNDAAIARRAWQDARAGKTGILYGTPGAPWRADRDKVEPRPATQSESWHKNRAHRPPSGGGYQAAERREIAEQEEARRSHARAFWAHFRETWT